MPSYQKTYDIIMNTEEELIIKACISNNRLAQQMIFNQYADKMFYTCLRYTANSHDAEDVMITAFTRVFKYIRQFEYQGNGSLEKWIRKIMVNESLRFIQKKRKIEWLEDIKIKEEVAENDIPYIDMENIMNIIQQLPDGYRTIFNLYVVEEYSHKEISEKLGISESTSKTQLHKARKKIIEEISKQKKHEGIRF